MSAIKYKQICCTDHVNSFANSLIHFSGREMRTNGQGGLSAIMSHASMKEIKHCFQVVSFPVNPVNWFPVRQIMNLGQFLAVASFKKEFILL